VFRDNTYEVPDVSGDYWEWQGEVGFSRWQAVGQDTTGAVAAAPQS
jgi:hypothetical protein